MIKVYRLFLMALFLKQLKKKTIKLLPNVLIVDHWSVNMETYKQVKSGSNCKTTERNFNDDKGKSAIQTKMLITSNQSQSNQSKLIV